MGGPKGPRPHNWNLRQLGVLKRLSKAAGRLLRRADRGTADVAAGWSQ